MNKCHLMFLLKKQDWHNFGHDYSKTLLAWNENFKKNWPKIEHRYGKRFYRLWTCKHEKSTH